MDDEFIVRRVRMRRGTAVAGNSTLSLLLLLLFSARVRRSLRFVLPLSVSDSVSVWVFISYILFSSLTHTHTDGRTVVDGDRVGCSTIHSDNANAIAQLTSTTQSNNNAAATALPLNFLSYSILLLLLLARYDTPRHIVL